MPTSLPSPYVDTIEQQIGRAELGEDTWGPHRGEFHVELKPDATVDQGVPPRKRSVPFWRSIPGVQSEVVTFLGDRISESLSGETAQVAVKVFGDDLDNIDTAANAMVAVLGKVPGIVDLQFKRQSGTPTISISLIPEALAALGARAQDVLDTIESAYAGQIVGQTYQSTRTINVVTLLPEKLRQEPTGLANLTIATASGPVPLSKVARITPTEDRYSIEHDGGQRRVSITFNVSKTSLGTAVAQARQAIARNVKLPPNVFIEFTGAAAAEAQTRTELGLYSGLALFLILVILLASFHWRANSGAGDGQPAVQSDRQCAGHRGDRHRHFPWAVWWGSSLSSASARVTQSCNSLTTSTWSKSSGAPWGLETVIRGANERLVPILMTAAVDSARPRASRIRAQPTWPGDRRSDGRDRPGRAGFLHAPEPVPAPRADVQVCEACGAVSRADSRTDTRKPGELSMIERGASCRSAIAVARLSPRP